MDQRLRPTERLQTAGDYRRVFQRGRVFTTPVLRIHYLRSSRELSRMGLVVSRRRGKSTVRSLLKRRLREIFRREKGSLPGTYDLILIPRGQARDFGRFREAVVDFVRYLQGDKHRRPRRRRPSRQNPRASKQTESSCR